MRSSAGRISILTFSTLALLILASCKSSPPSAADKQIPTATVSNSTVEAQPENIVLITLDTVRADHLHCYGNDKIKTPTIDNLASNGVLFEKAVAQTPLTDLPTPAFLLAKIQMFIMFATRADSRCNLLRLPWRLFWNSMVGTQQGSLARLF